MTLSATSRSARNASSTGTTPVSPARNAAVARSLRRIAEGRSESCAVRARSAASRRLVAASDSRLRLRAALPGQAPPLAATVRERQRLPFRPDSRSGVEWPVPPRRRSCLGPQGRSIRPRLRSPAWGSVRDQRSGADSLRQWIPPRRLGQTATRRDPPAPAIRHGGLRRAIQRAATHWTGPTMRSPAPDCPAQLSGPLSPATPAAPPARPRVRPDRPRNARCRHRQTGDRRSSSANLRYALMRGRARAPAGRPAPRRKKDAPRRQYPSPSPSTPPRPWSRLRRRPSDCSHAPAASRRAVTRWHAVAACPPCTGSCQSDC